MRRTAQSLGAGRRGSTHLEEAAQGASEVSSRALEGRRHGAVAAISAAALIAAATIATLALVSRSDDVDAEPASGPPRTAPEPGAGTAASVRRLGRPELAGQRIVAGFSGRTPPRSLERRIRRGRLAGVILFSGNFSGRADARRLTRRLRRIPREAGLRQPLLVMVDQEGGLVKRLPGPPCCSARELGRLGARRSGREGARTGRYLRRTGINVDLAPVLDVGRRGGAIDSTQRSFGRDPRRVAPAAAAFASGLRRRHVAPTAKHFPGLGRAPLSTDDATVRIQASKRRLRRRDELPYRRYIRRGARRRLVMLSTAVYPAFSRRPAAFSRTIATGELRGRLGFEGVSITDALGTPAARSVGGPGKVARSAARAGVDLLLFTSWADGRRAAGALREALASRRLPRDRFLASVGRVLELRGSLRGGER